MKTMRRIHDLIIGLAAILLLGASGCRGISWEEYEDISEWLTCDDCIGGERDRVAAIGKRAIPFLDEALDSLPGNRRDNMRAQYWELHQLIRSTEDSAAFVDGYLQSMETAVRLRSIASLGDLGAESVLRKTLDDPPTGAAPEVLAALEAAFLRTELPPIGTGTADTWAVVGSGAAVELCDGTGTKPCDPPEVRTVDLVATATGPSGTFANPWPLATIYFYFSPAGSTDPPREAGRVDGNSVVVTDNGSIRSYSWTVPFSVLGASVGPIRAFAIAAPPGDEPVRSLENTNITLVEGY